MEPVETDGGCFIPTNCERISEMPNPTGDYWRKMYQQLLLSTHRGWHDLPTNFEIQHTCGNSDCCNVEHLQVIPPKPQSSKVGLADEEIQRLLAWQFWYETECNMDELGEVFGISAETVDDWIAPVNEALARADERATALGL